MLRSGFISQVLKGKASSPTMKYGTGLSPPAIGSGGGISMVHSSRASLRDEEAKTPPSDPEPFAPQSKIDELVVCLHKSHEYNGMEALVVIVE